ncbi:MAG: S-layer homology domain-containing protein [Peptococcaceae bacterium]|nr:S-layer homology domain-containing protein [Peptococcaceae bacterium]
MSTKATGANVKKLLILFIMICLAVTLCPVAGFAAPTDISGHWAEAEITRWTNAGKIGGYPDGTFKPDNPITRAEFMALTNRGFNFTAMVDITFTDVPANAWYASVIRAARAAGYIGGYEDGTVRPNAPITREEVAAIVARIKKLPGNEAKANSFTDAASLTWSKAVVGAAAEAGIIGGYPDGSFGPKRPTTRAEAVAILDRALPAPVGTEETTTTTTGSSSDGSSEPTGVSVRLSGIEISGNGTLTPNFSPDTRTYTYETSADTVNVKGIPQSTSFTLQYSINGSTYSTAVSSANNRGVDAAVPGTGSNEVKIRVNRSGAYREYTVTLVKPGSGPGTLPEEISHTEIEHTSRPAADMPEITEVTLFVKPAYKGLIDLITVNGASAWILPDTAEGIENWFVRLEGTFVESQLRIEVTRSGSQEAIRITPPAGGWPEPVDYVTKESYLRPAADMVMTLIKIHLKPAYDGTLNGIFVNGTEADLPLGDGIWGKRFEADVNAFEVTSLTTDYTPPATNPPAGEADLIISAAINYSTAERAYIAYIYINQDEALNVQSIRITDDQGTLLTEYPGSLSRRNSPFNLYQGVVEEISSAQLNGKTVNIRVETISGDHDDTDARYASQ